MAHRRWTLIQGAITWKLVASVYFGVVCWHWGYVTRASTPEQVLTDAYAQAFDELLPQNLERMKQDGEKETSKKIGGGDS